MPTRLFDLGELQVASKTSKQPLYLACSITLDLPTSMEGQLSTQDLSEMTKSGQLWISKATGCRLEVAASVQGLAAATAEAVPTFLELILDAIGNCSIWEDLALKLRREPSEPGPEGQDEAQATFIVNHPDLTSASLAPKDTPCARFMKVNSDICYGKRSPKTAKRRKTEKPEQPRVKGRYGLRVNPKLSKRYIDRDTDDEDEDDEIEMRRRSQPDGSQNGAQNVLLPQENDAKVTRADTALLIKAAFSKLLGLKKTTPGVRIMRNFASPSLMDIAPGVWNIRYLQAFTSRAEHIPWIASCLSGLDAESPSLRAKIQSLKEGNGGQNDGKTELEKRLHILVQRGLADTPPVATSRSRVTAKTSSQRDAPSQQQEPELEEQDDGLEPWSQDVPMQDSQQAELLLDIEAENGNVSVSQQDGHEWLELSQASFILDENGRQISFEDLDYEKYSYQLVPLMEN